MMAVLDRLRAYADRRACRKIPRLFVDVSVIARNDAGTGIQRVVRALWTELRQIDPRRFEVIPIAGSTRRRYRRILPDFLQKPLKRLPWPIGGRAIRPRHGDVFLGIDLSTHIMPRNSAQVQGWRSAGMRVAVIVYDLLPIRHPEWFNEASAAHFRAWVEELASGSDALACISATVADDVRAWLNEQGSSSVTTHPQISAIKLGATMRLPTVGLPADWEPTIKWMKAGHSILMVGTIEPRKGHDQALAAFEKLWSDWPDKDWQLLIVGRPGWKTQELQDQLLNHPANGTRMRWIDDASDEYVEQLYAACSGVLVASRGEGLGLPLLDAAQHRKGILARDIPVFREVAPSGVIFFNGDTAEDMATALDACRSQDWTSHLDIGQVSWRETAQQLIQLATQLPAERLEGLWLSEPPHGSSAVRALWK